MNKFKLQEDEYEFPYHYIPSYSKRGFVKTRALRWGGEYLSYMKYVSEQIVSQRARTILDVGCGDGRLCQVLVQTGNFDLVKGIDLSPRAIEWAKSFNPEIEFKCMDVSEEDEVYDAVTAVEVIEHIPDDGIEIFLKQLSRVLKKDGRLYITVPANSIPVSAKHYRHYTEELLSKQIEVANCGLKVESSCYIVPNAGKWDQFYLRVLVNRFWSIDLFDSIIWKRYWKNGLVANKRNGSHVFAVVKKI